MSKKKIEPKRLLTALDAWLGKKPNPTSDPMEIMDRKFKQ